MNGISYDTLNANDMLGSVGCLESEQSISDDGGS